MRVLVTGSTGLIGSALCPKLTGDGHEVIRAIRGSGRSNTDGETVRWDPAKDRFDGGVDPGFDAVVHLAGASIADGRWNPARKELLRSSRIDATRNLIAALSRLQRRPQVVVSASAIGYYGNRGDEELRESSSPGSDFLAELCRQWEAETAKAEQFGARAVMLRFGIILAGNGGALPRMATPIKLGVGGKLGSGRQWMSWVTSPDVVNVLRFALAQPSLTGPVNVVAPQPSRNAEFTKTLAHVLHRPAIFPAPAFALRLALGEMADALLLVSQRVFPEKLQSCGYSFLHTELEGALRRIFQQTA